MQRYPVEVALLGLSIRHCINQLHILKPKTNSEEANCATLHTELLTIGGELCMPQLMKLPRERRDAVVLRVSKNVATWPPQTQLDLVTYETWATRKAITAGSLDEQIHANFYNLVDVWQTLAQIQIVFDASRVSLACTSVRDASRCEYARSLTFELFTAILEQGSTHADCATAFAEQGTIAYQLPEIEVEIGDKCAAYMMDSVSVC